MLPWIGKAVKAIDYYLADILKENGIELTKVQLILLKKLKEMNGESQHNLAFLTNRDKTLINQAFLTTMEKKNLVARIPSDSDQRINRIYITKHGERILKQAMPVVKEMIDEMQDGVSRARKKNHN